MILAQLVVGGGLLGMAALGPHAGAIFFGSRPRRPWAPRHQDIVIDAWRIEIADDADELGLLTSAYTLGFRAALLATEALILLLADRQGWPIAYGVFGCLMAVGLGATLFAREPVEADHAIERRAQEAPLWTPRGLFDAVVGPFVAFFKQHGASRA